MPRFAAIDVGSNASRLLVVDARDPSKVTPFRSIRVPVRLGHSVFQTGRLDAEAIDHCVAAMKEFAEAMAEADVIAYRAVVTASARGASNADVLLARVREEADVELTAVDGIEEARLVALAVNAVLPLHGHVLLADLGGGSLELSEMSGSVAKFSVSMPIGTVRLLEAFFERGGRVTDAQEELVHEYLARVLEPHRKRLRARPFQSVIATGGNFETIAKLCPTPRTRLPTIDVEAARALLEAMKQSTARERMARYGLREDRADVIVPALYVLDALARLTKRQRIVAPGVGLKDGVARELVAKHFRVWDYGSADDALFGAALQLGRRYHFDERHATQVTALVTTLFDGTKKLHGLGQDDRNLLRLAALLHDVGDFIHPSSHHKHSAYVVRNSDLIGLDPARREIVALLVRYHRKSLPTLKHPEFRALSLGDRKRVQSLAGLLRVADALDRGHRSKVAGFDVHVRGKKVRLDVVAEEDASLEAWTLDGKAELLEKTLGIEIALEFAVPPAALASKGSQTKKAKKPKKGAAKRDVAKPKTPKKSARPKKRDVAKPKRQKKQRSSPR